MGNVIETIQAHENYAVSEAEKLANNQTLAEDYKRSEIRRLTTEAVTAVDSEADSAVKGIETEIAAVRPLTRRPLAPPREDVAALQYTREMLQAKVNNLSDHDFYDMWTEAIDQGDTITARVFEDFGEVIIRQTDTYTRDNGVHKGAALSQRYNDLRQKTDEFLASPEHKAARVKLEKLNKSLVEIETTRSLSRQRLNAFKIDSRGKPISGDAALRQASLERQRHANG